MVYMMKNEVKRAAVNADILLTYGPLVNRAQLAAYKKKTGINAVWIRRDPANRAARGIYNVPVGDGSVTPVVVRAFKAAKAVKADRLAPTPVAVPLVPGPEQPPCEGRHGAQLTMSVTSATVAQDLTNATMQDKMTALTLGASLLSTVPKKDKTFVAFGDFDMVRQVIASKQFFPVYISGLSGNGKTFQVEQACAIEQREYVRCNITMETDEDDLLGGFRLRDGNTVFEPGPAIVAMLRGAVLLLDEVDLASAKLLCLQPIMEGKPITLKKLGITIQPTQGFTVFATANTKGRGDDNGHFVGTGLLNEAFLERFPVTVEQEYPSISVEKKILAKHFEAAGFTMTDHATTFFDTLSRWADAIRTTFNEGGIDDLISTRRLCHIVRAYAIFGGDDTKALGYCVNRFDAKTKEAFCELYNKLAPDTTGTPSNVGSLDGTAVDAPVNF